MLLNNITYGTVKGVANLPGSFGWANITDRSHSTPAHEAGHMFNAWHTKVMYQSAWWRIDVMFTGKNIPWYVTKHYDEHRYNINRGRIKYHIDLFSN